VGHVIYHELVRWRITATRSRLTRINLLALPLAVVSGLAFSWFARVYGKAPKLDWSLAEWLMFVEGILVLLAMRRRTAF